MQSKKSDALTKDSKREDENQEFWKPRERQYFRENDELWQMLLMSERDWELVIGDLYESSFGGAMGLKTCLE